MIQKLRIIINLKPILKTPQDPAFFGTEISKKLVTNRKISKITNFVSKKPVFSVLLGTISLFSGVFFIVLPVYKYVLPIKASASTYNVAGVSYKVKSAVEVADYASSIQKMPLLEAAVNINPHPKVALSGPSIVDGNSLMTETGPTGTIVDVQAEIDKSNNDQISLYTVHAGDTLKQVSKMFSVSPNTILWANDIKSNQPLKEGQVLVILPISGVKYTVKKGDTLKSIAKAFKGDADEIQNFNDLEDNAKLAVGTQLIIPDGEVSSAPVTKNTSKNTKTGRFATGGSIGSDSNGYFSRPINGGIKTQGLHGHNGIDLASYSGAPILAAADGEILIARGSGWNGGYGSYVVIKHPNGMQTLYGHLNSVAVSVGQHVAKGQTIGGMGNTGDSTGTHLHFEVRGGRNPF